jgi:hypothetical protein
MKHAGFWLIVFAGLAPSGVVAQVLEEAVDIPNTDVQKVLKEQPNAIDQPDFLRRLAGVSGGEASARRRRRPSRSQEPAVFARDRDS